LSCASSIGLQWRLRYHAPTANITNRAATVPIIHFQTGFITCNVSCYISLSPLNRIDRETTMGYECFHKDMDLWLIYEKGDLSAANKRGQRPRHPEVKKKRRIASFDLSS